MRATKETPAQRVVDAAPGISPEKASQVAAVTMRLLGVLEGADVLYHDVNRVKRRAHVCSIVDELHVNLVYFGDSNEVVVVNGAPHRSCPGVGGSIEYVDTELHPEAKTGASFARHVIKDPPTTFVPFWQ